MKEKGNEKEKSNGTGRSFDGAVRAMREAVGFALPWINREAGEEGPSYRVRGGAYRHGAYSGAEIFSFAAMGLTAANSVLLLVRFVCAFLGLQRVIVIKNPFIALLVAALPFAAWARATNENWWAFHRRKRVFFGLALAHAVLSMLQPLYSLVWTATVPLVIGHVTVNAAMTKRMVVLLAYLGEGIILAAAAVLLYRIAEPILKSKTTWKTVEVFKLQHVVDSRKDAENRYDFKAVTDLETGKPIVVKEIDRYVQMLLNGASGTGKTSSMFLNGIWGDLDVKFLNREARRAAFAEMMRQGKATIKGPAREFDESLVIPVGKNEKEFKKHEKMIQEIRDRYPDCGITVVAPNPDLTEHVIRMAQARGFKVNVLDPVNSYAKWECAKEMAINPFYLPLGLDEGERVIRISQAASNFADVLIATNQTGGSSDVYFTDISLSVSSNVAAVVMLAKNLEGQQAYIDDIHECISDFGNLAKYVTDIEDHFGIRVIVDDPRAKGENASVEQGMGGKPGSKPKSDEKTRKNEYYQQLLFVKQELLGPGREAMFSQARGLRNLMNKILQDPRVKRKFSADNDSRLDFDGILAKNEITVVSTAVELGQNISTAFGIFFLLLHRTSVLRRPKATRTPHFLWVDECAQYVHPLFDDVIALYRQYRVAAVLTLQTLTQLEKHRDTAYLKNVFLGAGTHVLFGRVAVEEMELYGKMAGQVMEEVEQKSASNNDVLSSSPTYTESVRKTPTLTNVIEGSDLRHLDFQELTFFTIDGGRVLYGRHARVFFLPDAAYDKMEQKDYDWKALAPEAFRQRTEEEQKRERRMEERDLRESAQEIPSEIRPEDETSFVTEKTETAALPGGAKGELEEMMESLDGLDLNEIYEKIANGEL